LIITGEFIIGVVVSMELQEMQVLKIAVAPKKFSTLSIWRKNKK
jgi:hypothetical protein